MWQQQKINMIRSIAKASWPYKHQSHLGLSEKCCIENHKYTYVHKLNRALEIDDYLLFPQSTMFEKEATRCDYLNYIGFHKLNRSSGILGSHYFCWTYQRNYEKQRCEEFVYFINSTQHQWNINMLTDQNHCWKLVCFSYLRRHYQIKNHRNK